MKEIEKKSKKKYLVPMIAVISVLSIVGAFAIASYFHSVSADINVNEARSSVDVPFSLTGYSGETACKDLTIHNSASVVLKAQLTYTEDANPDGVVYTSNLPVDVTLAPSSDTVQSACFTFDNTTPVGQVNVTINYNKLA